MAGFSYPSPVSVEEKQNVVNDGVIPKVGTIYNGSTVVDVNVEIIDRGTRIRRTTVITLENGIIMRKDYFKDKKFEEVDAPRRRAPPRGRSSDNQVLPVRELPKSKSGRHLPKPLAASSTNGKVPIRAESPARGDSRSRSSSRGRDVIVRSPLAKSKSSDLEDMQGSSRHISPRLPRRPLSRQRPSVEENSYRDSSPEPTRPSSQNSINSPVPLSPEATKRPSSLRNLTNLLVSPKRQAPGYTKSGNDLEALRNSLHSCNSKTSTQQKTKDDVEDTPRSKARSLRKLGNLIPKKKPGKALNAYHSDDFLERETKSEPFKKEDRQSTRPKKEATPESNKEKLKSFKEMIAASTKAKNKNSSENKRRRSSLQDEIPPRSPATPQRSSGLETVHVAQTMIVSPHMTRSPATPRHSTGQETVNVAQTMIASPPMMSPRREPSLSPVEAKKPASSSYITGFLDKLYDSYMKDDDGDGPDDNSEGGGYGQSSTNLLDMSLNKFVEWAE